MSTQEVPKEINFQKVFGEVPAGADWGLRKRRNNGGSPIFIFEIFQYIGEGGLSVQGTGDSPAAAVEACLKNYADRWSV